MRIIYGAILSYGVLVYLLVLTVLVVSVSFPGCVSRIRIFHPGSWLKKITDPGSALKNLNIFNPKNCS